MSPKTTKLLALSLVAIFLFNYPIMSIFAKKNWLWGIPAPFIYLFVVWFGMIVIIRSIARYNPIVPNPEIDINNKEQAEIN